MKSTLINDTTFKTKGRIIDINIYCNKDISETPNGIYEGQLDFYMKDNVRFCNEVCNLLKNYIDNLVIRRVMNSVDSIQDVKMYYLESNTLKIIYFLISI